MNIFKKIRAYFKEHWKEQWFRNLVIIAVMLFMCIAADQWRKWQDRKELAEQQETAIVVEIPEEPEKMSLVEEIWEESKFHFLIFAGLTAALITVKIRKSLKLEQTERKIEK